MIFKEHSVNLEEAAEAKEKPLTPVTKKHAGVEDENCAPWLFEDDILYRITVFLVITLQPERIYRILHRLPIRSQPVTDLMIVLPDTMQEKPFSQYEMLIEAGCIMDTNLSFSLHQASRVNTAIEEGQIFHSLLFTSENLMYWSKKKKWPVTPEEVLNERKEAAWTQFQNGFNKATQFLEHAAMELKQSNTNLTAFFLQQATELSCRALIASFLGIEKKTHSIPQLIKYCRRYTPVVQQIFPDNTPEEKRLLKLLDDAYLAARYEQEYTITQNDLDALTKKVIRLHEAILMDIKLKMAMDE